MKPAGEPKVWGIVLFNSDGTEARRILGRVAFEPGDGPFASNVPEVDARMNGT